MSSKAAESLCVLFGLGALAGCLCVAAVALKSRADELDEPAPPLVSLSNKTKRTKV
jgi:hypothetical protein